MQRKLSNSEPVENTNNQAKCQRDYERSPNRVTVRQQPGNDHTGESDDGADRQIDPTGDDNEGLADGQNRGHGALTQQVSNVVVGPEAGRTKRQHDPEQREKGQQGQTE